MRELALFSTWEKEGTASLARSFVAQGMEIVATGKSREYLISEGLKVIDVSELTGEPERFGGRLKTLHHKILGAILLRPEQDRAEWPYDFRIAAVVCNFYPFKEKMEEINAQEASTASLDKKIEWIDIGGPTMVRAAAKNHKFVWILTQPEHFVRYTVAQPEEYPSLRARFALEAFQTVAELDEAIVDELENRALHTTGKINLKYGENPHQSANFVPNKKVSTRFYGDLSYNNIRDAEAAFRFVSPFSGVAVSVVKHQTLCGAAWSPHNKSVSEVFHWAWEGDPVSRFGGVLCFNRIPDKETTEILQKKFIEVLVLPKNAETERWADAFSNTKERLKIVLLDGDVFSPEKLFKHQGVTGRELHQGILGKLSQEIDFIQVDESAAGALDSFGQWTTACSKSNSITFCGESNDGVYFLAGAGQGQPNRVDALKLLAIPRSKEFSTRMKIKFQDLSCYSDAFFPFVDSIEILSEEGFKRVVLPSGSKADADVAACAKSLHVELKFVERRHFLH